MTEARAAAGNGAADRTRETWFWAAALGVIALAALARFLFIAHYEIWLDEAYCFLVARRSVGGIIDALRLDNGPPLYYILLHYWMRAFGESPTALRSLSAVFSTASVAAIVLWDAPWLSRKARIAAGLLLAITPLAVYYGQETRMYAQATFFILASMICLERGLRTGRARWWAGFAAATALAFYTSYVAAFVAPLGYLVIAAMYARERDGRAAKKRLTGLVAAHAAAALLFAPWVPIFLRQPSSEATVWMRPMWQEANKALLPAESLVMMTTGGAYYPRTLRYLAQGPERTEAVRAAIASGAETSGMLKALSTVPPGIPLAAGILLAAALLFAALRKGGEGFPWRAFLALWVALALAAPFALSFARPMYLPGRYEAAAVPAFALLTGIGLARLRRIARIPAAALAAILFVYAWGYAQSFPKTGRYAEKAAVVAAAPQDAVALFTGFEYAPVAYYLGAQRDTRALMTFPREAADHAAWMDYDKWLEPPDTWTRPKEALVTEAMETLDDAISRAGAGGTIVIVRPGERYPWFDAMHEALGVALGREARAGRLMGDEAMSRPEMGVIALRVLP